MKISMNNVVCSVCALGLAMTAGSASAAAVTVRPLSATDQRPSVGQMHSTQIRHELVPSAEKAIDERGLKIAISENLPRGAGEVLRNSVWMAASVAGRTLGDPMADRTINLDVKGAVDGPSAGALYTVGMIAALRGDQIMTNATMTGTILPDGGIGDVGGIKQKLEAASKGGMSKVVLPSVSRITFDLDSGELVDVAEFGEKLGLSIVFVDDLDRAYYELTGNLLFPPSTEPAFRGDVLLPREMMDVIRARTLRRFHDVSKALTEYRENPGHDAITKYSESEQYALSGAIDSGAATAETGLLRGLSLAQDGEWVAAYSKLTEALVAANALIAWRNARYAIMPEEQYGAMIKTNLDIIVRQKSAVPESRNPVDSAIMNARANSDYLDIIVPVAIHGTISDGLANAKQALGERPPPNMLQKLFVPDTEAANVDIALICNNADFTHQAYLYRASAEMLAKADPKTEQVDPDFLTPALAFRSTDPPRTVRPLNQEKTELWAQFAQIRYSSMRDTLADLIATMDEETQTSLPYDPLIRRALMREELSEPTGDEQGETEGEMAIATQPSAKDLFEQALMMTREETEMAAYLLRVELGQQGGEIGRSPLLRGGSLLRLLVRSSNNARRAIERAQRSGYDVIGPRHDFMMARGLSQGDVDDQFKALRLFWQATAVCQLVEVCTQP